MKVTPLHLAALAVVAVDGLRPVGTREPIMRTSDFYYTGVLDESGKRWVVKYPLHAHAGTTLEAEAALAHSLLQELRSGNLPFDVLRPAGFAPMTHGRALVYPAPLGKMRSFDEISPAAAHELGRTLASIHSLDTVVVDRAGLPHYDPYTWRTRLLTELREADKVATIPVVLRKRWEHALENELLWDFVPTVIHGDVAEENFLWSEGAISCVLGFGESQVGDPALDFASLVSSLPEDEFDAVFESYQNALNHRVDENFLNRSILMSELALLRWLLFGIRMQDQSIIDDATQMLNDLAADIEADPELSFGPSWQVDTLMPDASVDSAEEASFTTETPASAE
ncbi:phosphotransferase [Arcanobacterium bovis]|nr:phosphotransferase [Arcanobacterium bovis]